MANSKLSLRITVVGKVQGVYFRKSTLQKAKELGVSGWVKNTASGNVEIWAEGDEMAIENFVNWCTVGPRNAVVTQVEKEPATWQGYSDFRIV